MFVTWLTSWGIRLNFLFVCDFVPLLKFACLYYLNQCVPVNRCIYAGSDKLTLTTYRSDNRINLWGVTLSCSICSLHDEMT